MSDYEISRIYPTDTRGLAQVDKLLQQENIERDKNLDYTVGMFDADYNLIATGSCFKNTLRCFAVDHNHQGEGLLNAVISNLIEYEYSLGNIELFIYTKISTAKFFGDVGFYEIARVDDRLIFMENRKNGFHNYLSGLAAGKKTGARIGAVVMNANPFTLGHQYLLQQASEACDYVHVFVVSEEASPIPFKVRYALVQKGSAQFKNLIYHPTGNYIISSATFPSYFLKDDKLVIESQAALDVKVFTKIAAALGINHRFVGEEPFSVVTSIYNKVMKEALQKNGILYTEISRKTGEDGPISASKIREKIKKGSIEEIKRDVPISTYEFFASPQANPIIAKIRALKDVIHY
jgi:[citrate (pro-3S)-lyase] ligase